MQKANAEKSNNGTRLDVCAYYIRRFGKAALSALLSLLVYYFIFYFFAPDIARAEADADRIRETDNTEAVFSSLPQSSGEGFMLFGGTHILKGGKRVNCDLLMAMADTEYKDNYFAFYTPLAEGECVVSKNLSASYGIKAGDTLTVSGTDISYKVKEFIPAVSGIDEKYMHEGVIILGRNTEVVRGREHSYLTFFENGDGYVGRDSIIFFENSLMSLLPIVDRGILFICLFFVLNMAVWELLIGRRSFADLRRSAELGIRPVSLYLKLISSLLFKYFLPAPVMLLIWLPKLGCYGKSFYLPMLLCLGVLILLIFIYSLPIYRRVGLCRLKKR
ncbi:MAG: hypothetical protein IJY18_01240 [Clostridia bacterium]|nr:hypothetical protein [Clostridia bacterium]